MSLSNQGRCATSKQVALAAALTGAERCSENEVVSYLDAMLHSARGTHGETFLVGKDIRRIAGLNAFLYDAIPLDSDELRAAIERGVPQGDRIWRHADFLTDYFRAYSVDFIDSPLRSVFYDTMSCVKYWRGPWCIFDKQAAVLDKGDPHVKRIAFSELISDMRQSALKKKIWKKMVQWSFPVDRNVVRVNDYIAYLFDRCSIVSVTEWEMWYPQNTIADETDAFRRKSVIDYQQEQDRQRKLAGAKGDTDDAEMLANTIPALPIDALARDLRKIFDNLGNKTSLSKFKIGHASSIEWSRMTGHSVRLMMFFDGSEIADPVAHTDRLGDYCIEATQGRMTYVNRNRESNRYPEAGLIHADDEQARRALLHRLLLWAQKEQFLRVKASSDFKTFRTGDIPPVWRAVSPPIAMSKVPDAGGATLDIPVRRALDGTASRGVSHSEPLAGRFGST